MALKLSINTQFGITAPDAYARIANFSGNKEKVQVQLVIYFNEDARKQDFNALREDSISIALQDLNGNILPAIYNALKAMPDYQDAVDA